MTATGLGQAKALEAKRATTAIPIVFVVGDDPVRHGLVAGIARPGGNVTGIHFFTAELSGPSGWSCCASWCPQTVRVLVLVNPVEASISETSLRDVDAAARNMGLQAQIFKASTGSEIDAAFVSFARERPQALFVGPGGRSSPPGAFN